jgi:high-affinity iron transporter
MVVTSRSQVAVRLSITVCGRSLAGAGHVALRSHIAMSETPLATPVPDGPDDRPARSRLRRAFTWGGVVVVLVLAAIVAAALTPSSHSSPAAGAGTAQRAVAAADLTPNPLGRQNKVLGTHIAAAKYGTQVAQRENGYNQTGPISDLTPLRPGLFRIPENRYRRYAEHWAVILGHDVPPLNVALGAGDRSLAKRRWLTAFSDYLHLGAVYELLPGNLNDELARVPSSTSDTDFPGLHRIEKGLWTGERLSDLVPVSTALSATVVRLKKRLPTVTFDPLDYVARGHEILEDAQRDLLSGAQVPWSGAGVLGTAAGIVATDKVIQTLTPLLNGRENTLGQVQVWMIRVRHVFTQIRRPDGTYPTNGQLTESQRTRINGVLAGALGALEQLPGTLEAAKTANIPEIPKGSNGR